MSLIIEKFIEQYKREFDYYEKISYDASKIIEESLVNKGIKAIVTSRAKDPVSLLEKLKLKDNNNPIPYKSLSIIRKDIKDLSGVRIALYFPSDKEKINGLIEESFIIKDKKVHPENDSSLYGATHYLVQFKKNNKNIRFCNSIIEIQVASVLMHARAEVEHDLNYKEKSGDISNEEKNILVKINDIVMKGENELEELAKGNKRKKTKTKKI
ncbi:MAG: RelA/SpoT domain-containing protein [Candidatus Gracilibacteria bacterium]